MTDGSQEASGDHPVPAVRAGPDPSGNGHGSPVASDIDAVPEAGAGIERWRAWATDTLPELARSAREAGARSVLNGRWLADTTMAAAERVKPRDHALLTAHHNGRPDDEIARALVRNASIVTASVGAATGALVTFQQAAPPAWAVIPFELAAETAIVVGIELKLVAELHQLADRPIEGDGPAERAMLLVGSWAEKRGVGASALLGGGDLLSRQARDALSRALRKRLAGRMGRNMASLIPLMAGAAAGAEINRRATRNIGNDLAADLGFPVE